MVIDLVCLAHLIPDVGQVGSLAGADAIGRHVRKVVQESSGRFCNGRCPWWTRDRAGRCEPRFPSGREFMKGAPRPTDLTSNLGQFVGAEHQYRNHTDDQEFPGIKVQPAEARRGFDPRASRSVDLIAVVIAVLAGATKRLVALKKGGISLTIRTDR